MPKKRRSAPKPQPAREIVVAEGADYKIVFDRETRDYAVEYRGEPVGWRASESEARRLVETLRYEDVRRGE
jgi:hypothetical protein